MIEKPESGFTLLECLFAISIACILIFSGWQFSARVYQRHVLLSEQNRLLSFLYAAKNQSFLRKQTVIICPKANIKGDLCPNKANWGKDLIALTLSPSGHTPVLAFSGSRLSMQWHGFQKNRGIRFNPFMTNAATSGRLKLQFGSQKRAIIINRIGRIRVS